MLGWPNKKIWWFFFFRLRRPQAGEAGLETGYPEKICHHDGRTKTHSPNRGRSIFFLVCFYRFWTHVKFFCGSRKRFSANCLFFMMISRDSQISSFESYTFLRRIQNENQLDVDIQFFVAWVWFLCSKRMISFFNSIGPRSRTSQF